MHALNEVACTPSVTAPWPRSSRQCHQSPKAKLECTYVLACSEKITFQMCILNHCYKVEALGVLDSCASLWTLHRVHAYMYAHRLSYCRLTTASTSPSAMESTCIHKQGQCRYWGPKAYLRSAGYNLQRVDLLHAASMMSLLGCFTDRSVRVPGPAQNPALQYQVLHYY